MPPPFSVDNTIKIFDVVDRYDMDFDDDVLYCYEIQLEADLMRQGLGRLVSFSRFSPFPFPVSLRFRFPFSPFPFPVSLLLPCVEDLLVLSSSLLLSIKFASESSVADPDPGPGAFLTPGSGIRDG
jgi:hypothetical protein